MNWIKKLFNKKEEKQCAIHNVIGCNQTLSLYFDLTKFLAMQPTTGNHKIYGRIYKGHGSYFDTMNFYPIIGEKQYDYVMKTIFPLGSFMSVDYWDKYDVRFEDDKIIAYDAMGNFMVNRLRRWFLAFGYYQ